MCHDSRLMIGAAASPTARTPTAPQVLSLGPWPMNPNHESQPLIIDSLMYRVLWIRPFIHVSTPLFVSRLIPHLANKQFCCKSKTNDIKNTINEYTHTDKAFPFQLLWARQMVYSPCLETWKNSAVVLIPTSRCVRGIRWFIWVCEFFVSWSGGFDTLWKCP